MVTTEYWLLTPCRNPRTYEHGDLQIDILGMMNPPSLNLF